MIDSGARGAISSELDVNMMVEAAAGTGKTTSLVTRIVELIRSGRCGIESIAAITFTVKAAAQLRERLHEKLEKARTAAQGEEKERIGAAIDGLDRAFIGTTHAFCARMLRERPVESGIDPEFEELDEVGAALMNEEFFTRWYDAQGVKNSAGRSRVADAGLYVKLLRGAFLRLVEYADVEMMTTECARPDLSAAVDAVSAFLDTCEPFLPTDAMREQQDDFEVMIRALLARRRSRDLREVSEQLEFLERGDHLTRTPIQKRWPEKKQAKQFGLDYAAIDTAHVRPTLRRWREYVHCVAIEFLRPAVIEFEAERVRAGTLSFSDLLIRSRNLLRDHPRVRSYFQRRYSRVLVDEFQDTDPIQAEVLFYLTGSEVEERNWRKLSPRPGSLFIVGDPKQSIYRFRRADITTYLEVKRLLQASGGRVEQLTTNFRSARPICDFVNRTFPTVFTRDDIDSGRQAAHVDLGAMGEGDGTSGVYVLETPDAKRDDVVEAEAACVAKWIARAVRSGAEVWEAGESHAARFSDFLLVSAYRPKLAAYARSLEAEGVPFEITGGGAFTKSQEIADVLPLLQVAADPDDTLSLVAFLRGPLCGASDDALYQFVKKRGRLALYGEIPEGADPAVAAGLAIAAEARDLARTLPAGAAMARIFERIALPAYAAVQEPAGTRAGNIMLALSLARAHQGSSESFADVVQTLSDLVETQASIEELDVDPVAGNVVRLMNLHQVKGLEAPVVFLIDPVDEFDHDVELYVDRSGETSQGYLAIREKRKFGARDVALPAGWDALAAREKQFGLAERARLLYVAATRAKSILVVGARLKDGVRKGIWSRLATVTQRLFPVDDGAAAAAAGASHSSSLADARAGIAARHDAASSESYSVLPVTKVAHANHAELVRAEEGLGKGMSWGRVLHRLFEELLRNPAVDVRKYASNLLKDEERDAAELEDVVVLVEAVRSSALWSRVMRADEKLAEVPFALTVPRREVGIDEDGDTLLHGAIDLVFREGDQWFVIDYKSDSTVGRLDALVAYYKPQVEHYARFWSRLTGQQTSAGLFFVDGLREVWV